MKILYSTYDSPIDLLFLSATDKGLCRLDFATQSEQVTVASADNFTPESTACLQEKSIIEQVKNQLDEYFAGTRKSFDVEIDYQSGTEFQRLVWDALRTIPYGETVSYSALARQVGRPKAARAIGGANNKNPIAIFNPCHRVIGADGSLVGFAGELWRKQALLDLEKRYC